MKIQFCAKICARNPSRFDLNDAQPKNITIRYEWAHAKNSLPISFSSIQKQHIFATSGASSKKSLALFSHWHLTVNKNVSSCAWIGYVCVCVPMKRYTSVARISKHQTGKILEMISEKRKKMGENWEDRDSEREKKGNKWNQPKRKCSPSFFPKSK